MRWCEQLASLPCYHKIWLLIYAIKKYLTLALVGPMTQLTLNFICLQCQREHGASCTNPPCTNFFTATQLRERGAIDVSWNVVHPAQIPPVPIFCVRALGFSQSNFFTATYMTESKRGNRCQRERGASCADTLTQYSIEVTPPHPSLTNVFSRIERPSF